MFQVTRFFDWNESKIFDLFSKSTVKWSLSKIKEILIDAAAQICRGKKMLLRLWQYTTGNLKDEVQPQTFWKIFVYNFWLL